MGYLCYVMVSDNRDENRGGAAHRPTSPFIWTSTPLPFLFVSFVLFGKHQYNTTLYLLLYAPMPAGIVVATII